MSDDSKILNASIVRVLLSAVSSCVRSAPQAVSAAQSVPNHSTRAGVTCNAPFVMHPLLMQTMSGQNIATAPPREGA